ncbi:hypothetical protein K6H10_003460 [Candida tropicalis]
MYVASPPQPSTSNAEILTRFTHLENIIAKHSLVANSLDDSRSVMMYDIREMEDNDELSISSGTTNDQDVRDELELSKDNNMEDIDQYDSDETF